MLAFQLISICARHLELYCRVSGNHVPDVVLGRVLLDNSLVEGRTASLGPRVGSQGTAGGDSGTGLVDESILVESSNGRVGDLREQLLAQVSLARRLKPN